MNTRRPHSPDYPSVGLKEAISRCKRLFDTVQMRPVSRELVSAGLGFNKMHGGAMSVMAALRKYGLLNKVGENLALTELAQTILLPKSEAEGVNASKEAALKPDLFMELHETFGPVVKDETLVINHLLRKSFLPEAAKKALEAYKETAQYLINTELAGQNSNDYNAPASNGEESQMEIGTVLDSQQGIGTHKPVRPPTEAAQAGSEIPSPTERDMLHGLLSRSVSYRLVVRGNAGPKELGNLIKLLETQKAIMEDDEGS